MYHVAVKKPLLQVIHGRGERKLALSHSVHNKAVVLHFKHQFERFCWIVADGVKVVYSPHGLKPFIYHLVLHVFAGHDGKPVFPFKFIPCQFFTVDDLAYLKRGGRISSATALIGTVLSIKPILCGDETGHIVSCGKVRGLKRAYAELANYFDTRALDKSESIGIAHADNAEGAQALLALLRDKGFTGECLNVVYEPVTGAHVGPGTVALFFYGKEK